MGSRLHCIQFMKIKVILYRVVCRNSEVTNPTPKAGKITDIEAVMSEMFLTKCVLLQNPPIL